MKCCKCYKEIDEQNQVKDNHAIYCQECHSKIKVRFWIGVGLAIVVIFIFLRFPFGLFFR